MRRLRSETNHRGQCSIVMNTVVRRWLCSGKLSNTQWPAEEEGAALCVIVTIIISSVIRDAPYMYKYNFMSGKHCI